MAKQFFKVDIVPALKRLEILSKALTSSTAIGAYKSVFKGKGLEFSGFREYTPEDDSSLIDWKASARTDQVLIKEYVEERNVDVFFLVDCSSNMLFGSGDKLKAEYNIELTSSLAHSILEAGDNVGVCMYSDNVKDRMLPSRGKAQFYIISKMLLKTENYNGSFDFKNAAKFIFSYLKKRGIIVIISDFIGWKDDWEDSIKLLSQKFDVIMIMIRDPLDRTLPEDVGQVVISDPKTGKTMLIEPKLIKEAYEYEIKEQERKIKEVFLRSDVDFVDINTKDSFVKPIINLFIRRGGRRWQ